VPIGFRGTVPDRRLNKGIDGTAPEPPVVAPPTEPTDPDGGIINIVGQPSYGDDEPPPVTPAQPNNPKPSLNVENEAPPQALTPIPPPPLPNTSIQGTFASPSDPKSLTTFRTPEFMVNRTTGNDPTKRFGPGDAALTGTPDNTYEELIRRLRGEA